MNFIFALHRDLASAASELLSDKNTQFFDASWRKLFALQVTFLNILDAAHHACFPGQSMSLPEVQYAPDITLELTKKSQQ